MGNDIIWQEIKWKLEEVCSPIAKEVPAASNLYRKQWPYKTLQEYIQNFKTLTENAMTAEPANVTNKVIFYHSSKTSITMTYENA